MPDFPHPSRWTEKTIVDAAVEKEWQQLRERLNRSDFRRRCKLNSKDSSYLAEKSLAVIRRHASDFIQKRLAPAFPKNDGKQTPMRGHPVFVAQHATATCCRDCLAKWHGIMKGVELTEEESEYVVQVILCWLGENSQM